MIARVAFVPLRWHGFQFYQEFQERLRWFMAPESREAFGLWRIYRRYP